MAYLQFLMAAALAILLGLVNAQTANYCADGLCSANVQHIGCNNNQVSLAEHK